MMCPSIAALAEPWSVPAATVQKTTLTPPSHWSQIWQVVGFTSGVIELHGTSVVALSSGFARHTGSVVVESKVFHAVGPLLQLSTFARFVTDDWLSLNAKSGVSSNWMSASGFDSVLHSVPPRVPPELGEMPENMSGCAQPVA